jgi:3-deoxy-D-manno-octulosonate 8-phosphate phosphatase (KDO 8-P phosphatase)
MGISDSNYYLNAKKIELLITDCDGVLTDTGVYYSPQGEELKRFSVRDGMGVERLRKYANIKTVIITGENSEVVQRRAEKLGIDEYYLGIKNKVEVFNKLLGKHKLVAEQVAYIGDDTNDTDVMKLCGFAGCPADATSFAKEVSDVIVESNGGYGAFRDFAEIIIEAKRFY